VATSLRCRSPHTGCLDLTESEILRATVPGQGLGAVTTSNVANEQFVGLRAIYPNRRYRPDQLSDLLWAIDVVWRVCLVAQAALLDTSDRRTWHDLKEESYRVLQLALKSHDELLVARLRLESPLDVTLVLQAGASALSIMALRLLVAALRKPEEIGSWLPRVMTGWQRGMRDFEEARAMRSTPPGFMEVSTSVPHASAALTEAGPAEVEAIGIPEPPEQVIDLVEGRS
jgi:hypothetical protein